MAPGVFTTVALLLYVGLAVLWDVHFTAADRAGVAHQSAA